MTTTTEAQAPAFQAEPDKRRVFEALDAFGQGAVIKFNQLAAQHNATLAKIEAIGGDPQDLLESLRESSTDPNVVKLNEALSELYGKVNELEEARDGILKVEVERVRADSAEELAKLDKELDDNAPALAAAKNYVQKVYKEAYKAELLTDVKRRKTAGGSSQTGVRRIRNRSWTVTNPDGTSTPFEHASTAAAHLETETRALQDAFFQAAGGEDSKKWSDEVTFNFTTGEGENAKTSRVTVRNTEAASAPAEEAPAESTPQANEPQPSAPAVVG